MTRNGCCTCTIQWLDANENWLNETIVARWPVKGIIHYSFKSSSTKKSIEDAQSLKISWLEIIDFLKNKILDERSCNPERHSNSFFPLRGFIKMGKCRFVKRWLKSSRILIEQRLQFREYVYIIFLSDCRKKRQFPLVSADIWIFIISYRTIFQRSLFGCRKLNI